MQVCGIPGQERHTPQSRRLQQPRRLGLRPSGLAARRPSRDRTSEDAFEIGDEIRGAERAARRLGGSGRGEGGTFGIAFDERRERVDPLQYRLQ
jgi:hypothetical protein